MTFFRLTLLLPSTFTIHKPFKHAKEHIIQLVFGKQKSCFSLFLVKMSLKTFWFVGKKEKGCLIEQILKNLLGMDNSGFLFSFFFFLSFEGKHLVPVKIPNLSCIFQNC